MSGSSPTPRRGKSSNVTEAPPRREPAKAPTCNVPSLKYGRCRRLPEWRGLCAAHRQTHRGLADPKESSDE